MFKKAIFILIGSFVLSGAVFALETEDAVIAELQAVGDKLTSLDKILMAGGLSHEKMMELSLKVVKLEEKEKKLRQTLEEYESSKKEEEVEELSESEKATIAFMEHDIDPLFEVNADESQKSEPVAISEESKSLGSKFKESANKAVNLLKDAVLGAKAEAQEAQSAPMCSSSNIFKETLRVNRKAKEICNKLNEHLVIANLTEIIDSLLTQQEAQDLELPENKNKNARRLIILHALRRHIALEIVSRLAEYWSKNQYDEKLVKEIAFNIYLLERINDRVQGSFLVNGSRNNNLFHFFGYALRKYPYDPQEGYMEVDFRTFFEKKSVSGNNTLRDLFISLFQKDPFAGYLNLSRHDATTLNKRAMPILVKSLECYREQNKKPVLNVNQYNTNDSTDWKTPLAVALDSFFYLNAWKQKGYLNLMSLYNRYMVSLMKVAKADVEKKYISSSREDILVKTVASEHFDSIIKASKSSRNNELEKTGKETEILNACFGNDPIP